MFREQERGTGGAHGQEETEEGEEEVGQEEVRASGPGVREEATGAGLGAAGCSGRRRLRRAARAREMARLAAGGWPGAPRVPLPRGGGPRAADVTGSAAPGRGAVGAETRGGRPAKGGSSGPRLRSRSGRVAAQFLPKSRPYPRAPRRRLLFSL